MQNIERGWSDSYTKFIQRSQFVEDVGGLTYLWSGKFSESRDFDVALERATSTESRKIDMTVE